jgi:hypothetical protein
VLVSLEMLMVHACCWWLASDRCVARRSERCAAEGPRLGRDPTFLYFDVVDAGEAGEVFRLAVVEKGDESRGAGIFFFFLLLCAGLAALGFHLAGVACVSIALRRNTGVDFHPCGGMS